MVKCGKTPRGELTAERAGQLGLASSGLRASAVHHLGENGGWIKARRGDVGALCSETRQRGRCRDGLWACHPKKGARDGRGCHVVITTGVGRVSESEDPAGSCLFFGESEGSSAPQAISSPSVIGSMCTFIDNPKQLRRRPASWTRYGPWFRTRPLRSVSPFPLQHLPPFWPARRPPSRPQQHSRQ